ncbi:MAG: hypothetical protein AAFV19_01310 [Pseudomonadota bacterium]
MTDQLYHWCQLANGDKRTCGYIEARGAKVGVTVELPEVDGQFLDVLSVGEGVPKERVAAHGRLFKAFEFPRKGHSRG